MLKICLVSQSQYMNIYIFFVYHLIHINHNNVTPCCFSIDHLSEIVRHTIEGKDKITNELVLQQQDFLLNEVNGTL